VSEEAGFLNSKNVGNAGKERSQNEKTRVDRFDYGLGFKRMRILWHRSLNKTGLDYVLEEPRRWIWGVSKTGVDYVFEGSRRFKLGVNKTGLDYVFEGSRRFKLIKQDERVFKLINAWRGNAF
jgi:hypothetical protein